MAEKIKVLLVEPLEKPRVVEVEHTLECFHDLVGGYIQAVYPWNTNAALICDDEGKYKGYRANRALVDEDGEPYDIVVGTFLICGISEDNFASLTEEQEKRFTDLFRWPELFYETEEGVMWMKLKRGEKPRRII